MRELGLTTSRSRDCGSAASSPRDLLRAQVPRAGLDTPPEFTRSRASRHALSGAYRRAPGPLGRSTLSSRRSDQRRSGPVDSSCGRTHDDSSTPGLPPAGVLRSRRGARRGRALSRPGRGRARRGRAAPTLRVMSVPPPPPSGPRRRPAAGRGARSSRRSSVRAGSASCSGPSPSCSSWPSSPCRATPWTARCSSPSPASPSPSPPS